MSSVITDAERKTRVLCAEISPADLQIARAVRKRLGDRLGRLGALAAQLAACQRNVTPKFPIKGMALFAADSVSVRGVAERVKLFLNGQSEASVLARQYDVKTAVGD